MTNINGYELVTTEDGTAVTGGLSHANGNCVVVTRLADGRYTLADSKRGNQSPVWTLNNQQFRRLGQLVTEVMTWAGEEMTADLGDGARFTLRHVTTAYDEVRTDYGTVRRAVISSVFSLTGQPDLTFTAAEVRAFAWGFMRNQWPEGQPVKQLEFTG